MREILAGFISTDMIVISTSKKIYNGWKLILTVKKRTQLHPTQVKEMKIV